jgi:chemotaxis signal transduction protein
MIPTIFIPFSGVHKLAVESTSKSEEALAVLCFEIDQGEVCLEQSEIVEVVPMVKLKSVPGSGQVEGICDYRGTDIAIVDLQKLMGIERTAYRLFTRIVIVSCASTLIGLILDEVSGLKLISSTDIRENIVNVAGSNWFKGTSELGEHQLQLLDLQCVFECIGSELNLENHA